MLWACRSFDPVCAENKSQPWYKLPDPLTPPAGTRSPVRASDVEGRQAGLTFSTTTQPPHNHHTDITVY